MSYEMLVGLEVVDEQSYARYRAGMTPILERYGGGFHDDFRIGEVLRSRGGARINRVFTIHFPDEAVAGAFFADEDYVAVKREHFEGAVATTAVLARYVLED